jgi:hydrogenase maturation protease
MKRPLIIGYGNPLRQDDGLGWRAAEILEASTIDVVRCHQLTPELAVRVADSDFIVFLDAAADQPPGAVGCKVVSSEGMTAWSHHLTPGQLLSFAVPMCDREPRAVLISGGPFSMSFGDRLTAGGEQCAKEMAEAARLAISGHLQSAGVQPLGDHAEKRLHDEVAEHGIGLAGGRELRAVEGHGTDGR